jgi:peroxiredoxin
MTIGESQPNRTKPQGFILFVVGLGLILVALAAFFAIPQAKNEVAQVSSSAAVQPKAVNYPAPDIRLENLDGKPVALSDYLGQVVLYNAWATWCPPCKEEMPTLNAYYQDHKQEGFVVVAIEDGEQAEEVRQYVTDNNLAFPVWPDPKWVATVAFKTDVLPTSFVIDRSGQVLLTWSGPISRAALEKYVTPIIRR